MSSAGDLFLGVIAVSVFVMALIQVSAILAGFRLAKRVEHVSQQIEQEIKPLLANLSTVAAEAARSAELASRQVERVDRLFGDELVAFAGPAAGRGGLMRGNGLVALGEAGVAAHRDQDGAAKESRPARADEQTGGEPAQRDAAAIHAGRGRPGGSDRRFDPEIDEQRRRFRRQRLMRRSEIRRGVHRASGESIETPDGRRARCR